MAGDLLATINWNRMGDRAVGVEVQEVAGANTSGFMSQGQGTGFYSKASKALVGFIAGAM